MKLEVALKSSKFKSNIHKAGLNILYTAWWLKSTTTKELKEYGITHEQYNVLRILKGKHPEQMCVKDIASRMIEKNSNVPRIIDRLVIKKLVKRGNSEIDKRETVMNITSAGISILDSCTVVMDKTMDSLIDLTEEEAIIISELLEKIRTKES